MGRATRGLAIFLCLVSAATEGWTQTVGSQSPQSGPQDYGWWIGGALAVLLLIILAVTKAKRSAKARETETAVPAQDLVEQGSYPQGLASAKTSQKAKPKTIRTLVDLKNEIIDRAKNGRPGLMTEWISTQTAFPTPDHVPIDFAVNMILRLYGGLQGLWMLFREGLSNYLFEDIHKAFGRRGAAILEALTERIE